MDCEWDVKGHLKFGQIIVVKWGFEIEERLVYSCLSLLKPKGSGFTCSGDLEAFPLL